MEILELKDHPRYAGVCTCSYTLDISAACCNLAGRILGFVAAAAGCGCLERISTATAIADGNAEADDLVNGNLSNRVSGR